MNEIESVFYDIIRMILPSFNADDICRVHQAFGMPSFSNTEDKIFFDAVEADADIAKEIYFNEEFDPVKNKIIRTHEKTITINIKFVVYGPNSYNNTLLIRDGFFREDVRAALRKNGLFIAPYNRPVMFFPEQLNGGWFQRYDFETTFNRVWISDAEEINNIEIANITAEGE